MFNEYSQTEVYKETETSIRQSLDNANNEWRVHALEILKEICKKRDTFTVNDFREEVEKSPSKTQDKRAMGGVMRIGQKLKWIKPTGETILSKVGHGSQLQIWKSLIKDCDDTPQQFPSKRHPQGRYVVLERDGVLSCSCDGFKFRKHCKHVNEVHQQKQNTLL